MPEWVGGDVTGVPPGGFEGPRPGGLRDRSGDYDEVYDRARDLGLCDEAAADAAYDAWRWPGRTPSNRQLEEEYGGRCG